MSRLPAVDCWLQVNQSTISAAPPVHLHPPRPQHLSTHTARKDSATVQSHYTILGVSPRSPFPVIRAAFRELILKHHPDRALSNAVPLPQQQEGTEADGKENDVPTVQALNQAWEILGDPGKRKQYDEWLAKEQAVTEPTLAPPSYALSVDLDLFTPHTLPDGDEADPDFYTYECRCSGAFVIIREQLEKGMEIVECDGCSERCRVEYDVEESS